MKPENTIIDIHSHILPGIDDGARSIAQSLDMARAYVAGGVTGVFATPHHIPGTAWAQPVKDLQQQVTDLQRIFQQNNISLKLYPGMEIALHYHLEKELAANQLLPLGNSNCYLLEPPFQMFRDDLLDIILSFKKIGKCVVLAHPERIPFFQKKNNLLCKLVEQGINIQVNIGSLLGKFGKEAKSTAMNLAEKKHIHFVGSDAHGTENRTPPVIDEWQQLVKILGTEQALAVSVVNPGRLLTRS
jgi:protein-tyrosine phosphatase